MLQEEGAIQIDGYGAIPQQIKKRIIELLYIKNETISSPDFGELMIRVASQKTNHSNISTSISPIFDNDWSNVKLLERFGVMDKHGHDKSLMTAFPYGPLKELEKIHIKIMDGLILLEHDLEILAHWNKKEIFERFEKKSKILLIRYQRDSLGFHLGSVKIVLLDVKKLDFNFVRLLKSGKITCESRMYIASDHEHCKSRGFKRGSIRNHGFGWRIKAQIKNPIFTVINILHER
jgi:hypothetical protein